MKKTYEQFYKEFGFTPVFDNEDKLHQLEAWCHEHISRDLHAQGPSSEKYKYYLALVNDYLDTFLKHVTSNVSDNSVVFDGMTPIGYTAWKGYDRFIEAQPADVALDKGNAAGMTPLHLAAVKGYVHTVQALLAKGAKANKINHESQLPIHSALFIPAIHDASLMAKKEVIFKALMAQAPTVIDRKDRSGDTVFQLMVVNGFGVLLSEILKQHPKGALSCNKHSQYPIHTAILNRRVDMVNLLLAIDKVSTLADSDHRVALHYAAQYGSKAIVETCCLATLDINIRDQLEKTPLMLAVEAQNIEAVEVLIQQQANVTLVDYRGDSVFQYAERTGNKDISVLILAHRPQAMCEQPDAEGHCPL